MPDGLPSSPSAKVIADALRSAGIAYRDLMDVFMKNVFLGKFLGTAFVLMIGAEAAHAQTSTEGVGSASAAVNSAWALKDARPKITKESLDFEIEYKVKSASVCVVWPEYLQDRARCTIPG